MMGFEQFRAILAEQRAQGYQQFNLMVCGSDLNLKLTGINPSGVEVGLVVLYKPRGDRVDKLAKLKREVGLFRHWIEADRVYREKGK